MNDRYLFKAKRIDTGAWVQGYITQPMQNVTNIIKKPDESGIITEVYEVDKNTICQCTGLKDKNGKLIWENDIVEYCCGYTKKFYSVGIVEYGEFNCSCCDGVYGWYFTNGCDIREPKRHEVIGNKFDNPELMEREVEE